VESPNKDEWLSVPDQNSRGLRWRIRRLSCHASTLVMAKTPVDDVVVWNLEP